ncbi:MAG TPA: multicopper oxidase family protein [Marmoricola sp.]|nr:multicopper oxidase family protein [Marmoricola sp.]
MIVVPLTWLWWSSRVPSSYSVMDMGYHDYGGGPVPTTAAMPGMEHDGGTMAGMPGMEHGTSVADLRTETTREPDAVYDLTARKQQFTLPTGQQVDGYTVNGRSPGPTLRIHVGDLVEVHLHNANVPDGITLHWHGVDVPNGEDGVAGVTQDAVPPGGDFSYRWVAPHTGTFWYHSHQVSHEQVIGGLFGAIVVLPRVPTSSTTGDVLAVAHTYDGTTTLNGRSGTQHVAAAPGQRVRVRVVNTDNGPQTVWTRTPFRLVATDGYAVHGPTPVQGRSVDIPAGGRAQLELTVPDDGAARIDLLGGVSLVVGARGARPPAVPQPQRRLDLLHYGTPAPVPFDTGHPDRSFTYSIGRRPGFLDGHPGLWWSVNGHLFPDMPMFVVEEGDVVEIHYENHSGDVHPMHLHGHHAVVLDRNGKPVTGSPWWFDSLDVHDGESYDIAFVADNPGVWMDHCHNLKHAAQGLVTHLMYAGVTEPFRVGGEAGNEPE